MVKSMTGYGSGENSDRGKKWSIEIRTVNGRFLDINVRMPRQYSLLEEKIRTLVKKYIARGRVDIYIRLEEESDYVKNVKLDKNLAKAYYDNLKELAEELKISFNTTIIDIAKLPEVLELEEAEDDIDEIWPVLEAALVDALNGVVTMRIREGEGLASDLEVRVNSISKLLAKIEERAPLVVEEYKDKLKNRLNELTEEIEVPESRFLMEVAIMAERSDITEEIVRLKSHLKQFANTIKIGGVIGRKLDFLIQEMHREINTIGSKSNDSTISGLVVDIKSELEKIREQVQNIE